MSAKTEVFVYKFSDIVMVAHRLPGRDKTTWYLDCPQCKGQHMFRKLGRKIWVTSCVLTGIEWTITPAEYYVTKPADFTRILGHTE